MHTLVEWLNMSNFPFTRLMLWNIHEAYLDRAAREQFQEPQSLFWFVAFVVFSYFTHSRAGFRGLCGWGLLLRGTGAWGYYNKESDKWCDFSGECWVWQKVCLFGGWQLVPNEAPRHFMISFHDNKSDCSVGGRQKNVFLMSMNKGIWARSLRKYWYDSKTA